MIMRMGTGAFLLILLAGSPALAFDHRHTAFTTVLQAHVSWNEAGTASVVDYPALKENRQPLDDYLDTLSAVPRAEFEAWDKDRQLAFLINAYNGFTLALILDNYPVDSIRGIGRFWQNPWKIRFFTLLGEKMHLDQVEHDIIREPGRFDEPRIHFAVNCASIGCPALRDEAFVHDRLDAQLEDSTRRFLIDDSRNRYNPENESLEVSSIFKWYGEDFERDAGSVRKWLARYADLLTDNKAAKAQIQAGNVHLQYLDYDWALNNRR